MGTCRHHAIYVKDEWTLSKVYPHMLACLFHAHGWIKFTLDLTEGSTFACVSVDEVWGYLDSVNARKVQT